MKTYILPRISPRQQTLLEEDGVEFHHWENSDILITGKRAVNRAMRLLGGQIVKEEEAFSQFVRLTLAFEVEEQFEPPPPPPPTTSRQFGRTPPTVAAPAVAVVVEEAAPALEPVVVTQPVAIDTERRARSRRNYIQACRERLDQIREAARERAEPMQEKVREAEIEFFNATRTNFLATAKMTEKDLTDKLTQEQEAVRNLEKVEMVRPTTDGILVFTKTLVVTVPDTEVSYKIGKFLIWLSLTGQDAGVYWFNANRRVDGAVEGMNAPYVFADGQSVAHEVKQMLLDLLAQFEVASAADLAIQFVENVDAESPFTQHLPEWPRDKVVTAED